MCAVGSARSAPAPVDDPCDIGEPPARVVSQRLVSSFGYSLTDELRYGFASCSRRTTHFVVEAGIEPQAPHSQIVSREAPIVIRLPHHSGPEEIRAPQGGEGLFFGFTQRFDGD
jgi:hypothetical protein